MTQLHHVALHVLGILGNIASSSFFLASLPEVMKMVRTRAACEEEARAVNGQLVKMVNCCMWVVYARVRGQRTLIWVLLTNSLGFSVSLAFLLPFFLFSPAPLRKYAIKKFSATSCALGAMLGTMLCLLESKTHRIKAVGILCGVVSSLVHLSLLSRLKEALALRDQRYLSPHTSILAFIKGGTWVTYGFLSMDLYIMVPNGVGVLTGCVQMLLGLMMLSSWRKGSTTILERKLSLRVDVFFEEEKSKKDVSIAINIPHKETFPNTENSLNP